MNSFVKSQLEAQRMMEQGQESSWESYRKDVLESLPGMEENMLAFLKTVFCSGFHQGAGMVGSYMALQLLQSKFSAMLGKEPTGTKPSAKPSSNNETQGDMEELLKLLEKQMSNMDSENPPSN